MQQHEKRLTTRLIDNWGRLKKELPIPEINQFNPASIDDLWPYCFRLTVERSQQAAKTYRYDYIGAKITEVYGKNLTGQYASAQLKSLPGATVLKKIDELVSTPAPQPLEDAGQFVNSRNKIVKYRSCLLPFGNEKDGVTHVIAGMSWKEF